MAALFPIPYEVDPGATVPRVDRAPGRAGSRTVVPFDRARAARRRRSIRRRNVACVMAAATIVVGIVLALGVCFAVIDAVSQPPSAAPVTVPAGVASTPGTIVVVQSGDTLTSIARELQPAGDITDLVDRLAAQHGPAPLQPGERLVVSGATSAAGGD